MHNLNVGISCYHISGGRIFEDFHSARVISRDDDLAVIGACYDRHGLSSIAGCPGTYRTAVKIHISNSVLEGDLPERICFTDREKNLNSHTHQWMASATAIRLPVTISKGPGIFSFHALYIP